MGTVPEELEMRNQRSSSVGTLAMSHASPFWIPQELANGEALHQSMGIQTSYPNSGGGTMTNFLGKRLELIKLEPMADM